jgi:anti-sigma factor RsiW
MGRHDELEMLSAYLDDEVSRDERARIDAHLPACAACRATLQALRATSADLALLAEPELPEREIWALRGTLARKRASHGRSGRRIVALSGAAAAVTLIAFGVASISGSRTASRVADAPAGPVAGQAFEESSLYVAQPHNYGVDAAAELLRSYAGGAQRTADALQRSASAPEGAADAQLEGEAVTSSADVERIQACERTLGNAKLEARGYITARFEGKPADFMIYYVPGRFRHFEMWIVDHTCYVLFVGQEPA